MSDTIAVEYVSNWPDYSGYGSANRAIITALYVAGVDVSVQTVTQVVDHIDHGWQGALCKALENRDVPSKVQIIHLTPDIYKDYSIANKYNIGHLFWETDKLPESWVPACNKMNEIWTSSPHMAELFKRSGVKVPIYSFPQPIDTYVPDRTIKPYMLPGHKGYLFYSIFHWIERKNPRALITSYLEAFNGKDDVSLLIKTHGWGFEESQFAKIKSDIQEWKRDLHLDNPPKIYLCKRLLTDDDMQRLHMTGDCYVQTDRGEGWSRPIAEALLSARPVISSAQGGIHEYLRDEHYFKIPSVYVPVIPNASIPWYTADQRWGEIDKTALKKAMLFAYNNPELVKAKGVVAKNFMKDSFGFHRIGKMMLKRLEDIYRAL